MVYTVIKRNGQEVPFQKNKVYNAIMKAFIDLEKADDGAKTCAEKIANDIENYPKELLSVEEIQDIVEKKLMATTYKDVAKAYINYRYLRTLARSQYKELWDGIAEKLTASNVQNQNANVDEHSFGGRTGEASSVVTKRYALENIVSPMARKNHEENMIYIHDLDAYAVGSHNCLTIPFDDILKNGFNTRQVDIRPAGSVNTAMQLVAVVFQLQSLQQFGGVSASHIDWTMVPYVRKSFFKHFKDGLQYVEQVELDSGLNNELSIDSEAYKKYNKAYNYAMDMTLKEVHQSVEALYHNLNSLQSRSGNQLPFTSINYGTCTLPEGRMVTKELLEVSIEGLGKLHKTSIFPCGIFQYMKGVNDKPGTPNYDLYQLALESTSKRLYPNYANVDWSVNAGYDKNDPCQFVSTINKSVA